MSKKFTASAYHLMSAAEKRVVALSVREPATTCRACGIQVMPADLLAHIDQRCPGLREPGQGSKWVTHAEALALGVARQRLSYWARHALVRTRIADDGYRLYLHRDLVDRIAERKLSRRRESHE